MPKLDNVNQSNLFCLFKGEPGTRKSTAALSFPSPQYWFSVDQKMNALTLPAQKWGMDTSGVEYDDYDEWDKMRQKLEWFAGRTKSSIGFKSIIMDSVTSAGDITNRQTLAHKMRDSKTNPQFVGGIPVDSLDSYKAEASAFREMIALLKYIHTYHGVNVVLIGHVVGERKPEEGEKKTVHSRIIVTGGKTISAKIAAYCNETYHFDIKQSTNPDLEGKYAIVTRHTGEDFARTSLPLPREIVFNDDPLYSKYLLPAIEKLQPKELENAS